MRPGQHQPEAKTGRHRNKNLCLEGSLHQQRNQSCDGRDRREQYRAKTAAAGVQESFASRHTGTDSRVDEVDQHDRVVHHDPGERDHAEAESSRSARELDEVGVATVDVPSKWNMEGGELLPEPSEEAGWLERHS